jgi:flagellar biosynthesis protein FliQ
MDWMPQAIREGIFTILLISGPLVILAAGLGLTIGILQAATQVQEQTLGSAVKIIGLFIAIIVFGFYMFSYMKNYTEKNIMRAFKMVPFLAEHPMPRKGVWMIEKEESEKTLPSPDLEPVEPIRSSPPNMSLVGSDTSRDEVPVNTSSVQENLPRPSMQASRPVEKNIQTQTINPVAPKIQAKPESKPIKPESKSITIPEAPVELTDRPALAPRTKRNSLGDRLKGIRESAIDGAE